MRKGFTIIELLVASLLLGFLVTILTMIFNQSSIAWRTGIAGTAELSAVRENIAEIREEADDGFVHDGKFYRVTSLWDTDGTLRERACDAPGFKNADQYKAELLGGSGRTGNGQWIQNLGNLRPDGMRANGVGNASTESKYTYSVNVMSGGPNNDINDWEAIWSYPYDFDL